MNAREQKRATENWRALLDSIPGLSAERRDELHRQVIGGMQAVEEAKERAALKVPKQAEA